jgi:hypothetical protein
MNPDQFDGVTTELCKLPWGDVGPRIQDVRDTLEYLMLLTRDAFAVWENELADRFFASEFDLPLDVATALPTMQRLAHVARLVRSMAMTYGIRTDYALAPEDVLDQIGEIQADSPAWILDRLDSAVYAGGTTDSSGSTR